jgi:hypothetical protein
MLPKATTWLGAEPHDDQGFLTFLQAIVTMKAYPNAA